MFKSVFRGPESGIAIGLIEAIGVYAIYNNALPTVTSVRNAQPHDTDVEGSRKSAAIKSSVLIVGVFFLSRDLNAFIIGGTAIVGMDYMYKHGNAVNPGTGKLDLSGSGQSVAPGTAVASQPLPEYSEAPQDGTY